MRDSADTVLRENGAEPADTGIEAAAPSRRVVGVVRVLRGRLAAPCRCCSDATAARLRTDDDGPR